ncbi:MAG: heavy-metal-associated domain-containing protein [Clostridia bacterium]|nr:heavy-metal-associated domain-containing protein [Clostridia bacterium]
MFGKSVDTKIDIDGMSCPHCVKRVQDTLNALKGVKKAKVDLASKSADVSYVESKISRDEIVNAVNHLGFCAK